MRLLTLLTIAFCLKPIQTNAVVTESIPSEVVWQFATYAYKVGLVIGSVVAALIVFALLTAFVRW